MLQKLVLLSLAAISIARPDGAPICDVDTFDTSNHGGATSDLKFDIAVTPEGNKATIAINDQFVGLLLYVSDASGKHVGTLQSSTGDFKNSPNCGGKSTITHSSSASKSGKFEWTGTETGPLTVNAIIMKDEQLWNIFKVPLQIGQSPVNNEQYPTQKPEPIAVPQASSPVQDNPYAESNPPKKTYPKRKNYKRKNYKRKNYKKKNYKKKKTNSSSNDSSKRKHSSSAKKPCPKTYNKNK